MPSKISLLCPPCLLSPSQQQQQMVRAMPSPKRVGGGLPVQSEGAGGGGGDLLDLMSMDIGGDGAGAEGERFILPA